MPHSSSSALHGVNLNLKKNSTIINFDPPLTTKKIKILKNEKNVWICHHFTHVNQKLQSHDASFLSYGE